MLKFFPSDDDDLEFFKQAMKDVKQSKTSACYSSKKHRLSFTSHITKKEQNDEITDAVISLTDPPEQTIEAQDKLFFSRPGLQRRRIKQLIDGKILQSACLDLHRMTVAQARLAVMSFLMDSRKQAYRCVRIIHGKGQLSRSGAKLKNHLNFWLQQISWILAFCSAQAKDGGTGAVYVLLRRIR